jgi:hypothetical protein
MKNKIGIKYFGDAGHGWYRVDIYWIKRLGLTGKISFYSYVSKSGKFVYLEEDRDADLLFQAIELNSHAVTAHLLKPVSAKIESKIRELKPYIVWPDTIRAESDIRCANLIAKIEGK